MRPARDQDGDGGRRRDRAATRCAIRSSRCIRRRAPGLLELAREVNAGAALGALNYFISDLAPDLDALDTGRFAGWARTGKTFKVWPISQGFLNDVCRFYIPPEHGNSHFFSASPAECATVSGLVGTNPNYSGYVLRRPRRSRWRSPTPRACALNIGPVYRLWNQRADSNHRYRRPRGQGRDDRQGLRRRRLRRRRRGDVLAAQPGVAADELDQRRAVALELACADAG